MPRPAKPPRLTLIRYKDRPACWVIRDGQKMRSTRCGEGELPQAEERLGEYIAQKYRAPGQSSAREIFVSEILATYTSEHVPTIINQECIGYGVLKLLDYWGEMRLSDVRAVTCRDYVCWRTKQSVSDQTARHELETLRAAINYYHREYTLESVPTVTLPPKAPPRSRWMSRAEIAGLLRSARRTTQCDHLSRFILIGVYTGTRSKAILSLTWTPQINGGWIDMERGVMHRAGIGQKKTKKRQPPVRIPSRLMNHLRRWQSADRQRGINHVVSYKDQPINSVKKSWAKIRENAELDREVVAHTLRHTCATWLMQAGVDIFQASGFLGMSPQTLERVYGHHHPDFQLSAAESFGANKQ